MADYTQDGVAVVTDLGRSKLRDAAFTGLKVDLSHIAFGDGNGATYDPARGQAALKRERHRRAVERQHPVDDDAWRVFTTVPADAPSFQIREIGFFDTEGDLIALWAGRDIRPRYLGATEYLADYVLDLSAEGEGLVIINAPDDEVFALAVVTAKALAALHLEQNRQADAIRAAHGAN